MHPGKRLIFWLAMPLVAPQALLVRWRAPRFPAPDGPVEGVVGEGPPLRLVGIGDSVIAGVGAGRTDRGVVARTAAGLAGRLGRRVAWRALGRVGARAGDVREALLPAVDERRVDIWLVSVGVNDTTSLSRTSTWRARMDSLLAGLDEHSPGSVVALLGVPPLGTFPLLPWPLRALLGSRSLTLDEIGASVAASHGAIHCRFERGLAPEQFAEDGYHPSAASHQTIADAVVDRVAGDLRPRTSVHA